MIRLVMKRDLVEEARIRQLADQIRERSVKRLTVQASLRLGAPL
jgi:hypothetical protein